MQNQERLSLKRYHRLFARGYFLKKSHQLPASLYTILQVLSVTLFKKNPHFKGIFAIPLQTINPNIKNEPYLPGF